MTGSRSSTPGGPEDGQSRAAGPDDAGRNTVSLMENIEQLGRQVPRTQFYPWRPGDQRYYVSDTSLFQAATGWSPRVGKIEGVGRLHDWLLGSRRAAGSPASAPRSVFIGSHP